MSDQHPVPGQRVRIRSFCPTCDQHIESISRAGDGPMRFDPCGHEVTEGGRIEVTHADPDPQEDR